MLSKLFKGKKKNTKTKKSSTSAKEKKPPTKKTPATTKKPAKKAPAKANVEKAAALPQRPALAPLPECKPGRNITAEGWKRLMINRSKKN